MARFTTQFPGNKTQAQLDALTKPTINDFKVGFVYWVAERVGDDVDGTTSPDGVQKYQHIYVMRDVVVTANTINTDLVEFQSHLRDGSAYTSPNNGTTTAPATTTVP